jgi:hypothetical protein
LLSAHGSEVQQHEPRLAGVRAQDVVDVFSSY